MSKQRTEPTAETGRESTTETYTEIPAEHAAITAESGPPARRFRDTRYLSRTLVREGERKELHTAQVKNSEISTHDPDWIAHLEQDPDFEPIE